MINKISEILYKLDDIVKDEYEKERLFPKSSFDKIRDEIEKARDKLIKEFQEVKR